MMAEPEGSLEKGRERSLADQKKRMEIRYGQDAGRRGGRHPGVSTSYFEVDFAIQQK